MTDHPLTDVRIYDEIITLELPSINDDLRAAFDLGYAQALEDVQDTITCIQRKDSPTEPITLEELEAMRPLEKS